MSPIFITGIGTDVGKTIAAAVITEALGADYWKPVQAGFEDGTDALSVQSLLSNHQSVVHEEVYKLKTPASPHIAARKEGITIDIRQITDTAVAIRKKTAGRPLIVEGAGGLLVPVNQQETVADLIKAMQAKVILVSRNYLGSINHSLLTASYCRSNDINVLGWIFNDDYMQYETEIVAWSGYASLGSIPKLDKIDKTVIRRLAAQLQPVLTNMINNLV